MKTNGLFIKKEDIFDVKRCEIEKIIELSTNEFFHFKHNMIDDHAFIEKNKVCMYQDETGTQHCLLILGHDMSDGILVQSEGYNYARYAAFLPNAREYLQMKSKQIAEQIIKDGIENTSNGRWFCDFKEIEDTCGVDLTKHNDTLLPLVKAELMNNEAVVEIDMNKDGIEVIYYLDFCSNAENNEQEEECIEEKTENNELTILKIDVEKEPYIKKIPHTLEAMKAEVGGFIECVTLKDGAVLVCNEEGKLKGLPLNRPIGNDIIAGDFFMVGTDEYGELASISEELSKQYTEKFGSQSTNNRMNFEQKL